MIKAPEKTSNVTIGTAYEINKSLVEKNEIELKDDIINTKKDIMKEFVKDTNNKYYMLLCREKYDYTVFSLKDNGNQQDIINILVDECLKNRGIIKGIDVTKSKDAIEIWLSIDRESYCYYFFPYDCAVIDC